MILQLFQYILIFFCSMIVFVTFDCWKFICVECNAIYSHGAEMKFQIKLDLSVCYFPACNLRLKLINLHVKIASNKICCKCIWLAPLVLVIVHETICFDGYNELELQVYITQWSTVFTWCGRSSNFEGQNSGDTLFPCIVHQLNATALISIEIYGLRFILLYTLE